MLLQAKKIVKEYGERTVLEIESLTIEEGDRIGLIGPNGAGKSTLLGLLAGRIPADDGQVKRFCPIAEIRQDGTSDGDCDGQYASRMGVGKNEAKSGGERTRLAIAAAFSRHAPLLFADEPTTSLDMAGVRKLEQMLAGYRGAVLMVSHDRSLLDAVCTCIWELEDGHVRVFEGNYSQWRVQKERERDFAAFEYGQYQKEKKRLMARAQELGSRSQAMKKLPKRMGSSEWLLYKGTASIQQGHVQSSRRAVRSRLEHLEEKQKPAELPHVSMKLPPGSRIRAPFAVSVRGLTVEYGGREILSHVDFQVESGTRAFLTGENGAGKTTLIRAIAKRRPEVVIPGEVRIGYFSQDREELRPERTVLENVLEDAALPQHICRAVLANLYMSREDMQKPVGVLSGGERVKTALAKVLVSGCNFLILDEPANHMDIYTLEGLERLLADYDGTLLAVSHDRAFIARLADRIYRLENGRPVKMEPIEFAEHGW